MMSTALLIIDIQIDYFPGGKMELEGSQEAGLTAGKLLAFFRQRELPVVHIQHIAARQGATFFLPGTTGVEIHASVRPGAGEKLFQKHYPNSFRETGLLAHLQGLGIQQLVVAGMMTHMCLDTSVRAATDLGFQCWTVADACATRALAFAGQQVPAGQVQAAFLAALHGSFGKVMPAETVLSELSE